MRRGFRWALAVTIVLFALLLSWHEPALSSGHELAKLGLFWAIVVVATFALASPSRFPWAVRALQGAALLYVLGGAVSWIWSTVPWWLCLASLVALVAVSANGARRQARNLRDLAGFLNDHQVAFNEIKPGGMYGWPGYSVIFDSLESGNAFRHSPEFQAFLDLVGRIHRNKAGFDPRKAVTIEPWPDRWTGRPCWSRDHVGRA